MTLSYVSPCLLSLQSSSATALLIFMVIMCSILAILLILVDVLIYKEIGTTNYTSQNNQKKGLGPRYGKNPTPS
jgi:hypothetical protein